MNWDSAAALLGSGAGVVASAVAVMTYRRQFAERPVEPEPEPTMVLAGRRPYGSDYGYRPAPAPPLPRAPDGQRSARLTLVMFLLGLVGAAAAVVISRPKGYNVATLPLVGLSDLITFLASIRLIVLLQRQWKAHGLSRPARAGNSLLVLILTVGVLIGLGGAWTLVYIDYLSRVDSCVAGGWIVDSHVMGTTPFLTGKGAHLNLTRDGDGVLSANNIEYTATTDGHRFRAIETFTMTFVFAAHDGHLSVDDFRRQVTEKATIDGKAWDPLNGPDFAGILNSFGGYVDFTCSGSQLMISDIGTVLVTAHRGI